MKLEFRSGNSEARAAGEGSSFNNITTPYPPARSIFKLYTVYRALFGLKLKTLD